MEMNETLTITLPIIRINIFIFFTRTANKEGIRNPLFSIWK